MEYLNRNSDLVAPDRDQDQVVPAALVALVVPVAQTHPKAAAKEVLVSSFSMSFNNNLSAKFFIMTVFVSG